MVTGGARHGLRGGGGRHKPEGRRQFRCRPIVAGVIATVVLALGCGFLATSSDLRERQISGTPTADPIEVVAYADERETQAIADRKAADDAFLAALETEVKQSVRNIGNEAANYFGQNQKLIDASGGTMPPTAWPTCTR